MFCRILVPPSGIKPGPLAMKGLSPTHWMTREMGDIVSKTTSYDGSCQGLFHYNSFWLFCFFFCSALPTGIDSLITKTKCPE